MQTGIASVIMIWSTTVTDVLDRHSVLESFRGVYDVGVILSMILQVYVLHFPVADYLICVVPDI